MSTLRHKLPLFSVVGYLRGDWTQKLIAAADQLRKRENDKQFYEYAQIKSHVSKHFPIEDGGYKYIAVTDIAEELKGRTSEKLSAMQMYKLAARGQAPHLDDRNYTELKPDLPADLVSFLKKLGPGVSRVRFATLGAGKSISAHIDNDASHTIRIHIPLITNDKCTFTVQRTSTSTPVTTHFCVGSIWFLNSAVSHRADNLGDTDRLHLVVNMNNHDLLTEHPAIVYD